MMDFRQFARNLGLGPEEINSWNFLPIAHVVYSSQVDPSKLIWTKLDQIYSTYQGRWKMITMYTLGIIVYVVYP